MELQYTKDKKAATTIFVCVPGEISWSDCDTMIRESGGSKRGGEAVEKAGLGFGA